MQPCQMLRFQRLAHLENYPPLSVTVVTLGMLEGLYPVRTFLGAVIIFSGCRGRYNIDVYLIMVDPQSVQLSLGNYEYF